MCTHLRVIDYVMAYIILSILTKEWCNYFILPALIAHIEVF
jgi:hypothetical protein